MERFTGDEEWTIKPGRGEGGSTTKYLAREMIKDGALGDTSGREMMRYSVSHMEKKEDGQLDGGDKIAVKVQTSRAHTKCTSYT